MKYAQITNTSSPNATLYAESIPHLLHWDLAYLWILEKVVEQDVHQIPPEWQDRVGAWKHLVGLFLTGEARVVTEEIKEPLRAFTVPYGVTEVNWLVAGSERIGVLSPTVLVRPLPDFRPEDRSEWPKDRMEVAPKEVKHFTDKVVAHLQGMGGLPFAGRLASVLVDMFKPTPLTPSPAGHPVRIPLLRDVRWTQSAGAGEGPLTETEIFVQDPQGAQSGFLPRCTVCNQDLLFDDSESIEVEGDAAGVHVHCRKGHENALTLSDLMIWNRPGTQEAVVWLPGGQIGMPQQGAPPVPSVEGSVIRFSWNPAMLQEPNGPRHLAIRFPGKRVLGPLPVTTIFFQKLLVAGDPAAFQGLPVTADWRDALSAGSTPQVQGSGASLRVAYPSLRVAGWPEPVALVYTGALGVQQEPDLNVGVFPDPNFMPPGWKWYRTFAHGPKQSSVTLSAPGSEPVLPWVLEARGGPITSISVTLDDAGVSFRPEVDRHAADTKAKRYFVGVDFGTTNTIAYALNEAQQVARVTPLPTEHGLKPSALSEPARWLTGIPDSADVIAGFMPGNRYGLESNDPFLAPSALWSVGRNAVIRWGSVAPIPSAVAVTNFKLDGAGDASERARLRKQFAREFLLLLLPSVIKSTVPSERPVVRVGLAFPLALTHDERKKMDTLYESTLSEIGSLTGIHLERLSIDEAQACVVAFGQHNPDTSFLIADMGGGTLDLALFTTKPPEGVDYAQLGSVRFAGEAFVEAIAARMQGSEWDIRDAIRKDQSSDRYGHDQNVSQALRQFNVFAFELLRTLALAFRRAHPAQPLQVVLVGNGWHLVTAFDPAVTQQGPKPVFRNFYEALTRDLGLDGVSLYGFSASDGGMINKLPSTKHLVVIGALRNAASTTPKHQLTNGAEMARLPAGRLIEIVIDGNRSEVQWQDLVGDGAPLQGVYLNELHRGQVNVDVAEGPGQAESWQKRLQRTFGISDVRELPYPGEAELRHAMLGGAVQDSGDQAILPRGPLQIVLETKWAQWLKDPNP